MKKPNFFIIGAPKCGTTSLAAWLSEHPSVYMSPIKEPDYFYTNEKISSLREYEQLFEGAGPEHIAVGEASVRYLYSQRAIPNILHHYGEKVKFIVMLRNPIDMAPSLHRQRVHSLNENEANFEKAWRLQNEDGSPRKGLSKNCYTPETNNYGPFCKLGEQIERLFQNINSRHSKLILLDDIRLDPRRVWLDLMDFLEIEDDGRVNFEARNKAKTVRNRFLHKTFRKLEKVKKNIGIQKSIKLLRPLYNWNVVEEPCSPLSETMRAELREYFKDDIQKLSLILNRDLSHWR